MKLHLITTALLFSLQLYGSDTQASDRLGCLKRKSQRLQPSLDIDNLIRQTPEIPQVLFCQLVQDEIRKNAAAHTPGQRPSTINIVQPEQFPIQPIVPIVEEPCFFAPLCIGCAVLGHQTMKKPTWKEYAFFDNSMQRQVVLLQHS